MDSAIAEIELKARTKEEAERLAEEENAREEAARAAIRDAEQSIIDGIILPELQKAAEALKRRYPETTIDTASPEAPVLAVRHGGSASSLRFTSGHAEGIVAGFNDGDPRVTNTLEQVQPVITRFILDTIEQLG